jgi:hypothetical protein
MYWRATVCYRKIDGKCMVTHEYNSVPFDSGSGERHSISNRSIQNNI